MRKSLARAIAMQNGDKFYTPESPCVNGHTKRRTTDGSCVQCKLESDRLRTAQNREAYNARKKQERIHKLPELAIKARISRQSETTEQRAQRLEKARLKQVEWRLNNPNHAGAKAAKKAYKKNNPGKVMADGAKRRAAQLRRTPNWLNDDDYWMIEQAYELSALRTKMFGFAWHVDHVLPLQGKYVSGLHVPTNLQVIPAMENLRKAHKYLPA